MKRDMDLVREILLDIESVPAGCDWEPKDYGKSRCEVLHHIRIMSEAGLLSGKLHVESDDSFFVVHMHITWHGYEFLDASRNGMIWDSVKQKALEKGVSLTFDGLLGALKSAAQVGLSTVGSLSNML